MGRRRAGLDPPVYSGPVSDLPLVLPDDRAAELRPALDQERKIDRALESLGPLADRDVLVLGGGGDELAAGYAEAGARVTAVEPTLPWPVADASTDAVVSLWSGFRGVTSAELAEADRVLRPGGRILVVHDYGRDDVARLRGERRSTGRGRAAMVRFWQAASASA